MISKYVYKYIECITDQSNWSRPFSQVVVYSLYNLGVVIRSPVGALDEIFFTDFSPPTTLVKCCCRTSKNVLLPDRAISSADTRLSRHNHSLSYLQIPTDKNYYRFTLILRSIIHWNVLPAHIPVLPIVEQFSSAASQVIQVFP